MSGRILYRDESYAIVGACFEVYKEKGNGFLEAVYQECLVMELADRGNPFVEQPRLALACKGRPLRLSYQPDFPCFGKIVVEIKAVKSLADEHRARTIDCLKATGHQLGLLVNFGHHPKVESERFANQLLSRLS
jgi:GxxExxY protein